MKKRQPRKWYSPYGRPKKLSPTQRQILENVRDGHPYWEGLSKHGVQPALHVVLHNDLMQWGIYSQTETVTVRAAGMAPLELTPRGIQALADGHYGDLGKAHARALRYGKKRPPRPPNVEQPPLNARKLKLDSGVWRYTVTRRHVSIWSPSGKLHEVAKERPVAVSICGCGEPYNCLPERAVTPGSLRRYIEQHLLV